MSGRFDRFELDTDIHEPREDGHAQDLRGNKTAIPPES